MFVTQILVNIFVNRWVLLSLSGLVLGSTVYELFITNEGKLDQEKVLKLAQKFSKKFYEELRA